MTQIKSVWTTVLYLFTVELLLYSTGIDGSGKGLTIIPSGADFLKSVIGNLHQPNRKISINDRIDVEEYTSSDAQNNDQGQNEEPKIISKPFHFNIQSNRIVRPAGTGDNNHGESSISQIQYLQNNDYSDSQGKIVSHDIPSQESGYVPTNSLMHNIFDSLTGENAKPDGQLNGYDYYFYPLDNKDIHQLQTGNVNFPQTQFSGNSHVLQQLQQQQQQQQQQHLQQQHHLQQLQHQQQQLQLYYGNNNYLQPYGGGIKPVTEQVHDTSMNTDTEQDNSESQVTQHKVEPLFVAMAGFVGVAVVFLSALILIPRFPGPILEVNKGVLKQAPEELASLTKLVAESIDGKDCSERITCEVGRAMRSLQVGTKPIRVMEILLPPAIAKQLAQVRRSASKKEQCHFITCKRTEGTLKLVAKLKKTEKTIHNVKEIFNL